MQKSFVTNNLIKAAVSNISQSKNLNILYVKSNTFFDVLLGQIDNICLTELSKVEENVLYSFSYDFFISNNPIEYSDLLPTIKSFHLKDIVLFHSLPDSSIKKEDKFLIRQTFKNSRTISIKDNIKNSWEIPNSIVVKYGIPKLDNLNISLQNKKSVVLLNLEKSRSIDMLYHHIKNYIPDVDMIKDISSYSLEELYNILNQYKVCIDIKSEINCLISIYCGCKTISSANMSESGALVLSDYNNIIEILNKEIGSYSLEESLQNQKTILEKYNFEVFNNSFLSIFNDLIKESFVYE
jgi:hypothetical protein